MVGEVISGLVFRRIGHVKWQLVGCCVGFTAFLGGMAAVDSTNRGLGIAVSFYTLVIENAVTSLLT